MNTTVLTSKGQITLPKAIRDRLALRQGDRLQVAVEDGGRVTLQLETRPAIDDVYGMLQRLAPRRAVSLAAMRRAVRQRAKVKHGRSGT